MAFNANNEPERRALLGKYLPALGVPVSNPATANFHQLGPQGLKQIITILNGNLPATDPKYIDPNAAYTPALGASIQARVNEFKQSDDYKRIKGVLGMPGGIVEGLPIYGTHTIGTSSLGDAAASAAVSAADGMATLRTNLRTRGLPEGLASNPALFIQMLDDAPNMIATMNVYHAGGNLRAPAPGTPAPTPGAPATDPAAGGTTTPPAVTTAAIDDATATVRRAVRALYAARETIPGMKDMPSPGEATGPMDAPTMDALQFALSRIKGGLALEEAYNQPLDGTYTRATGQRLRAAIAGLSPEKKAEFLANIEGGQAGIDTVLGALDTLSDATPPILDNTAGARVVMDPTTMQIGSMARRFPGIARGIGSFLQSMGPFGQMLMMLIQAFVPGLDLSSFLGDEFKLGEDNLPTEDQLKNSYMQAMNSPEIQALPPERRADAIKEKLLSGFDGVQGWLVNRVMDPEKRDALKAIITEACDKSKDLAAADPAQAANMFAQTVHGRLAEQRALLASPAADASAGGGQPESQRTPGTGDPNADLVPGAPGRRQDGTITPVDVPPSSATGTVTTPTDFFHTKATAVPEGTFTQFARTLHAGNLASGIEKGHYLIIGADDATRQSSQLGNRIAIVSDQGNGVETRWVDISQIEGGLAGIPAALGADPSQVRIATPRADGTWLMENMCPRGTDGAETRAPAAAPPARVERNERDDRETRGGERERRSSPYDRPDRGERRAYDIGYRDGYGDATQDSYSRRFNEHSRLGYPRGHFPDFRRDHAVAVFDGHRRGYEFQDNFPRHMYGRGGDDVLGLRLNIGPGPDSLRIFGRIGL